MNKLNLFIARSLSTAVHGIIYGAAYLAGLWCFFECAKTFGIIIAAVIIPVIAFAMAFLVILETAIFRILIPKPKPGVHKIGSGAHFIYELNRNIFNAAINPVFPPLAALFKCSQICRTLILKSLGTNIRLSASVSGTAKIYDPYLLTIGTTATIDDSVEIYSSSIEGGKILLFRIFIGPKSHIGASSLIFPGTEIGEGSVLGMGSSTRNEMKIPPYELWVGNPASHLSKLFRPVLYTAAGGTPEIQQRGGERPQGRFQRGRDGRGGERGDSRRRGGRFDRNDRDNRDRRNSSKPFERRPSRGPAMFTQVQPQQSPSTAPATETPDNAGAAQRPVEPKAPEVKREDIIVPNGGEKPYIGPIDLGKPAAPKTENPETSNS